MFKFNKEFLLVLGSQLIVAFGGLCFNKLLSVFFEKEVIGQYFYLLSISTFGVLLFTAPFTQYFNRKVNTPDVVDLIVFLKVLIFPLFLFFLGVTLFFTASVLLIFLFFTASNNRMRKGEPGNEATRMYVYKLLLRAMVKLI